jgi:phage/plasmid-like protein (TIGR03299 family)
MPANLTVRKDGFVEHAYAGEVGWTGMGNRMPEGATVDEWIKAAGCDWEINRSDVFFADGQTGEAVPFKGREVLHRSDTGAPLSVVSSGFRIVQPAEIIEFFRDLLGGAGFSMETAGTLGGGRKFWALARVAEGATIGEGDRVYPYCLAATSCDG